MAPAPAPTLLDRVRTSAAAEADAARAKMQAAVAYASAHPGPREEPLSPGQVHADHEVTLAGPGSPGVSEFALVELAAALGKTPASTRRYLGDAIELAHRLPRLWGRVVRGEVEAWRAQAVAQRTKQLSAPAAAWVDSRVADRATSLGPRHTDRLVEEALTLFDLDAHVEQALSPTYVHLSRVTGGPHSGLGDLAHLDATVSLVDALALERALSTTAHSLLTDYPDHTLDERRALALGRLADHATTNPPGNDDRAVSRQLSLVVHLDEPALAAAGLARVHTSSGDQHLVTVESVATWCVHPGTKVTVRPVIDLATPLQTAGYTPSPALRDQVGMLSQTCAFPHCTTPTERCDLDHITPWHRGGPTHSANLAPLCRLHHRAKTHGGWIYHQPDPGTYHWTSPSGHHYRRDRHGTTVLVPATADRTADPPTPLALLAPPRS